MAFFEQDVGIHIDEQKLQARVRELGAQITRDYQGKELTLVCVLRARRSSPWTWLATWICR